MTLTLTSDDLESHIVVNVSSTLTNTTIWLLAALFDCGRTDGLTYVRTLLPGLLGHLSQSIAVHAHRTTLESQLRYLIKHLQTN